MKGIIEGKEPVTFRCRDKGFPAHRTSTSGPARPVQRDFGRHQLPLADSSDRSQIFGITSLEYPEMNLSLRPLGKS